MAIVVVDYIKTVDGETEVVRGYLEREIKQGMIFWSWSDSNYIIPVHRIASITVSEE